MFYFSDYSGGIEAYRGYSEGVVESVDFGLDGLLVHLESVYRVDEFLAGGCFASFQLAEAALDADQLPLHLEALPVEEDEEERGEVYEVYYLAEIDKSHVTVLPFP